MLGVGSVTITAHEAVVPFVVKYFPEFPVWLGSASIVTLPPRDTAEPLIVMLELVRDALAILLSVLLEPLIVLLVRVCESESVATVESIDNVTVPDVPPPDSPVPAVTPVMSPGLAGDHSSPVAVAEFTLRT